MIVVYTAFNRRPSVAAPCGSPKQVKHCLKYDEYGRKYLSEDGCRCVYDEIQSFRQETDIKTILSCLAGGDTSVLMKKPGFNADISNIPDNIHELSGMGVKVNSLFATLPDEVKKYYGDAANLMEELFAKGDIDSFANLFKKKVEPKEGDVNAE